MKELAPEPSEYFTYEDQYRAAGWKATIDVMARIGIHHSVDAEQPHLSAIKRLCGKSSKDPSDILTFISSYHKKTPTHLSPTPLVSAGILQYGKGISEYSSNPDFEMAVLVFSEDDDFAQATRRTFNLDRLLPYINKMSNLYLPEALETFDDSVKLSEKIRHIQHDSAFHIGMLDGDDQLDLQHIY